ncbi:MAG: hypothetical protein MZW92_58610 [Comamonadaceae bacterium]|nr:hypothetical protein [Comamonadaceae bacterium]
MRFDADRVRLANGREAAAPARRAGHRQPVRAADLAVHHAARSCCEPGSSIDIAAGAAAPRRPLDLRRAGARDAAARRSARVRRRARRSRAREPRPGGELAAEMWFAPTLQYLPVRIVHPAGRRRPASTC